MYKIKQLIFLSIVFTFSIDHLTASTLKKDSAIAVDLNALGEDGCTVLTRALSRPFYSQKEAANRIWMGRQGYKFANQPISAHEMQELIKGGADINKADAHGNTPLHAATGALNSECVGALLALKANPNARNQNGDGALHILMNELLRAVDKTREDKIFRMGEILISHETTDLDMERTQVPGPIIEWEGSTALAMLCNAPTMWATRTFNFLIERGADYCAGGLEDVLSSSILLRHAKELARRFPGSTEEYASDTVNMPCIYEGHNMLYIIREKKRNQKLLVDACLDREDRIGISVVLDIVHSYYQGLPEVKQEQSQQAKVELIS